MYFFEVNIRICQPENRDVYRGLTYSDVNRKRMQQLFCYMTLSHCAPFPSFILSLFIFINLLKSDNRSALKSRLFQEMLFKFFQSILYGTLMKNCFKDWSHSIMRCAKMHF